MHTPFTYITKHKAVTRALEILALMALPLEAQTLTKVVDNGPSDERLNIVILSEGYTEQELSTTFVTNVNTIIDNLFTQTPFKEYKTYFNVYTISVASNESGSDHPSQGIYKDTYFNSTFDSFGIQRLTTLPPNNYLWSYNRGLGRVMTLLRQLIPDYDIPVVLINDSTYGGSGGNIAIASTHSLSSEIVIHELGHSFGKLTDEYDTAYPGWYTRTFPNSTSSTDLASIPWNHWIEPLTPIPTPENWQYDGLVGLFEGCQYQTSGWYRPHNDCKMKTLNTPFCPVCREAFVKAIYQPLDIISSTTPNTDTTLSFDGEQNLSFSIETLQPHGHDLILEWYLDDTLVGSGATYNTSSSFIGNGTHTLRVDVADETSLVRTDTNNALKESRTWNLSITNVNPNTPPSIIASDSIHIDNNGTGTLELTLSDTHSDASTLTLIASPQDETLLPTSALTLYGSGSTRYLDISPSANLHGATQITLTVYDGQYYTQKDVIVNILSPRETWENTTLSPQVLAAPEIDTDPDKDGIPNLLEFAFGTDPETSTQNNQPTLILDNGDLYLQYYQRRNYSGLTYSIQTCTDPSSDSWSTCSTDLEVLSETDDMQLVRTLIPSAGTDCKFFRLHITED